MFITKSKSDENWMNIKHSCCLCVQNLIKANQTDRGTNSIFIRNAFRNNTVIQG